ncbi:MAG: PrgI family protein [Candidatus Magasanikbacteria bacterium]
MQQFVVPQFIEVEDKIFGPITVRQFLILLVTGTIIFFSFRYGDFYLFLLCLVFFGGLGLIFSFVKINGQNFHYFILNVIQSLKKPDLRVWHKHYDKVELNYLRKRVFVVESVDKKQKKVQKKHIRDLALLVNTGGFYKPDDDFSF